MNPFKVYEEILNNYLHEETIPFLEKAWNESHRKYHNIDNHLNPLLIYIDRNRFRLNPYDYHALILAAFFHDAYYNPRNYKNNEGESIKRFIASYKNWDNRIRNMVIEMIEATKYRKRPTTYLIRLFWDADNADFYKGYEKLLENEKLLRKEFKHIPKKIYKKKRIEFLESNFKLFDNEVDRDLIKLIKYINK